MRLSTICLPFLGALLFTGEIAAQCTTCDGKVEVTFRGAMCAEGTFTVQLHDKTIGLVTGQVWRTSSPQNSASIPEIKVTEIQGTVTKEQVFSAIGGTWLSTIIGLRSESPIETTLGNGDKQIETTVFHPTTSLIVSQIRDVYHAFPWGTEKISSIKDPNGDALTTVWAYHEDSMDAANYGRLKWVIQPDGS